MDGKHNDPCLTLRFLARRSILIATAIQPESLELVVTRLLVSLTVHPTVIAPSELNVACHRAHCTWS